MLPVLLLLCLLKLDRAEWAGAIVCGVNDNGLLGVRVVVVVVAAPAGFGIARTPWKTSVTTPVKMMMCVN